MKTNTKLETIGKKNPFKVPEGYFETFSDKLMSQLPEKEKQEVPVINMWERMKPWVYMVAMFVGIMLMVNTFVNKTETSSILSKNVEEISISEIDDFYSYYEDKIAHSSYQQMLYSEEEMEYFN